MKRSIRIAIYIILILILTTLGTLGLTEAMYKKENNKEIEENTNEIIISDSKTKDSTNELLIYLYTDETCEETECQKLIRIKTETEYARELDRKNYANYILIYDGVIKLINVNTKEQETLEINYVRSENYKINLIDESENEKENINKKIDSITGTNGNNIKYLDYNTLEYTESENYTNLTQMNEYYIGEDNDKILHLLDYKGLEIIPLNKDITINNIKKITVNNNYISVLFSNTRNTTYIIYDLTGKEIQKKSGNYLTVELGEDEIYVYETGKITNYDLDGKIIKIIDLSSYEVKYTYNNFMFAIKDNNLICYDISENQTKIITNLTDKEVEEITYKNGNKKGIYITINNLDETNTIYYNLETSKIENLS